LTIVYFVLLLGVLIFFHEFGHFVVARACGVRVLEFSIGFGPTIAAFERGGTVYRIGILPLGGFVRMLGADPTEEVSLEDEADSFNNKELWKRTLVVLAGPAFNLILPFIVFFFVFISVSSVPPAIVGTLTPDGVAEKAGIRPGDVVTSIGGESIAGWWELQRLIGKNGGNPLEIIVERDGRQLPAFQVTPALVHEVVIAELGVERSVGRIQVALDSPKAIVVVDDRSAAHAAGLRSWDHIVAVDGHRVYQWEVVKRTILNKGAPVQLNFLRAGSLFSHSRSWTDAAIKLGLTQTATLDPRQGNQKIGLHSSEFVIRKITEGSAALPAGLQQGDELLSINGRRFALWDILIDYIRNNPGKRLSFRVRRGSKELQVPVTFEQKKVKDKDNYERVKVIVGLANLSDYSRPKSIPNNKRLAYSLHFTWTETARFFNLTFASLAGLFTGKVSFKQMGGPIAIYEVASKTGTYGWQYFFNVMVWLSISLGLINLLPIPMLDGGHLAFFLIEFLKRSPVSLKTRQIASYIGLSMIVLLMVMVFKNDIERNWDRWVESDDKVTETRP
jgi:regulator of sigma E protease